ncbi:MAG: C39 family peptidase [Ruminococcus sp.]|nr:C39 family peptidase [Ruminococcus sp.]
MLKIIKIVLAISAAAILCSCESRINTVENNSPDKGTTEAPTEVSSEISDIGEEQTEAPTEKTTEAETTEPKKAEKKHSDKKTPECIEVPYISQEKYPTGCELVSTAMVMTYYGYEIEPLELIESGYMETSVVEYKNGKLYGGDPNEVFVGDPRKNTGYGCYAGAVCKALKKYFENESCIAYAIDDCSLPDICDKYIDSGQPVIIWASINMMPIEKSEESTWLIDETDEEFTWLSNEHCMVLVGYDDEYYYIHDPLKDAFTPYKRSIVEKRYEEMGRQAITFVSW